MNTRYIYIALAIALMLLLSIWTIKTQYTCQKRVNDAIDMCNDHYLGYFKAGYEPSLSTNLTDYTLDISGLDMEK